MAHVIIYRHAIPHRTEAEWQVVINRRLGAVTAIHESQAWRAVMALQWLTPLQPQALASPNPYDRTLSKRHWEALMQHWRDGLRHHLRAQPEVSLQELATVHLVVAD